MYEKARHERFWLTAAEPQAEKVETKQPEDDKPAAQAPKPAAAEVPTKTEAAPEPKASAAAVPRVSQVLMSNISEIPCL